MADNQQTGTDKTTAPKFPTEKISGKPTQDAQPHVPPDVQGQKRAANPNPSESQKTREDGMKTSDDLDKH